MGNKYALLLVIIIVSLCGKYTAQSNNAVIPPVPDKKSTLVKQTATIDPIDPKIPLYAFEDYKKFVVIFKGDKVPTSFPTYNSNLTRRENREAAAAWFEVTSNRELVKPEELVKVDAIIKNAREKNNNK